MPIWSFEERIGIPSFGWLNEKNPCLELEELFGCSLLRINVFQTTSLENIFMLSILLP